jgi:hypothetical protein
VIGTFIAHLETLAIPNFVASGVESQLKGDINLPTYVCTYVCAHCSIAGLHTIYVHRLNRSFWRVLLRFQSTPSQLTQRHTCNRVARLPL